MITVVDTSGSMDGIKIKEVKDTLKTMLEELGEKDTLTLIKFDREAEALFEYLSPKLKKKEIIEIIENKLSPENSTQIFSGMDKAFELI